MWVLITKSYIFYQIPTHTNFAMLQGLLALNRQCHQITPTWREIMLAVPRFPLALAQITHAKMVPSLALTFTRPILQLNVIITDHGRPQVNKRLLPHRHCLLQVSLWFQKHGRNATLYQRDFALILQLHLTMVESIIGTQHLSGASLLTTHL